MIAYIQRRIAVTANVNFNSVYAIRIFDVKYLKEMYSLLTILSGRNDERQFVNLGDKACDSLDFLFGAAQLEVEPVHHRGHDKGALQVHDQTHTRTLSRSLIIVEKDKNT